MGLKSILFLLIGMFFLVNLMSFVSSATPITQCGIINTPGEYYLANDITMPENINGIKCTNSLSPDNYDNSCYCIYVKSNDVIINGNYKKLIGEKEVSNSIGWGGIAIGALAPSFIGNANNITIKNLNIENFFLEGIILGNVSHLLIYNNTIREVTGICKDDEDVLVLFCRMRLGAINIGAPSFTSILGNNNLKIIRNVIVNNYGSGILITYANNSIIKDNHFYNNSVSFYEGKDDSITYPEANLIGSEIYFKGQLGGNSINNVTIEYNFFNSDYSLDQKGSGIYLNPSKDFLTGISLPSSRNIKIWNFNHFLCDSKYYKEIDSSYRFECAENDLVLNKTVWINYTVHNVTSSIAFNSFDGKKESNYYQCNLPGDSPKEFPIKYPESLTDGNYWDICDLTENYPPCRSERTFCRGFCSTGCGPENWHCNYNNLCEHWEGCQCSDCYGKQSACADGLVCDATLKTCQEPPIEDCHTTGECDCNLCPENCPEGECTIAIIDNPTSCAELNITKCSDPNSWSDLIISTIEEHTPLLLLDGMDFCNNPEYSFDAEGCEVYFDCGCYWDGSSCNEQTTLVPVDATAPGCTGVDGLSCITETTTSGDCNENEEYLISWTADWNGTGTGNEVYGCLSGEKTLPCPPTESKIPLFTLTSLILTVISISLVYFIFSRKKK